MLKQLSQIRDLIIKKTFTLRSILLIGLSLASVMVWANPPKAVWYRYYDSKGVANLSSTVTQNHLLYGYEALDSNMQVIQRARPYNAKKDTQLAPQGVAQAKQNEADARLKRAYNSSQMAIQKRDAALSYITKQIKFQQDELNQYQKDRVNFLRREKEFLRKGEHVPENLKNMIAHNSKNILMKKQQIQMLQTHYRNTQTEYDQTIARLKMLE